MRSSGSSVKMLEFHALDCRVLFKSLRLNVWLLVGWHFLPLVLVLGHQISCGQLCLAHLGSSCPA